MNKTKKELYEENQRLKKSLQTYSNFWETDAIDECTKQSRITKIILQLISVFFLISGAFLIGLVW